MQPQQMQQAGYDQQMQQQVHPCQQYNDMFTQCIGANSGDISQCQMYMDNLMQCQKSYQQ